MWLLLFGLLACGSSPVPETKPVAPAEPAAPSAPPGQQASVDLVAGSGFGALFWRDGKAFRSGGGDQAIGPGVSGTVQPTGTSGACGEEVSGAPEHAVVVVPAGSTPELPKEAPANRAGVVERAAWRLDEILPPRDAYSSAVNSPDPALQRGIRVASVAKTRRLNAPPVLLSSGARDCVEVVAALDQEAAKVLAWDRIDDLCQPLSLLPAADYDGDGQRELAGWNDQRVVLWRLRDSGGSVGLVRIADHRCE